MIALMAAAFGLLVVGVLTLLSIRRALWSIEDKLSQPRRRHDDWKQDV